ncbi:hypothetical protein [Alicyclobacillus ferrooxydans]|uniref:Uncharacterized protein n=1 Tax=Alicyclobacillus ferrooxydans TaxID=471514 RepID=A0A0P9C4V5_9BACL|nr:hypothetical protein [Alicyclobacillus ferrooxydans]KPV39846.1 hypothetical protein AN477_22430 [Alicyclobacillus ferrooxydans]
MSKRIKGIANGSRQVLSGLAVVAVVFGGLWFSQHPLPFAVGQAATAQSTVGGAGPQNSASTSSTGSTTGASDPYGQKLQDILNGVAGMQEVALESGTTGETVTATIQVSPGTTLANVEDALIKQYMSDVFDTDPLVQTANVYFINDGQFVAGGGLSRAAYDKWAVSTSTSGGDVQAWMAGLPTSGAAGSVSGWFETASPLSSTGN